MLHTTAKILLDSVNIAGVRLVTWELTYPRMVHSELMTHRVFSRSSASSRAIPIGKMLERITMNPAMPYRWGKNQSGMQASANFEGNEEAHAVRLWLEARDVAVQSAAKLRDFGLHKQIVNRVVETWMWIVVIMSTTYHANWFEQRDHEAAEPSLGHLASLMHNEYWINKPKFVAPGNWHMPLLPDREQLEREGFVQTADPLQGYSLQMVSAGRCARVSYLNHHGVRDPKEDIALFQKMSGSAPSHRAPLEHAARSMESHMGHGQSHDGSLATMMFGNFQGWKQLRHYINNEAGPPEPRFNHQTGECINYDPTTRKPL